MFDTLEKATGRCWLEVDLDALRFNVDTARETLHGRQLAPVLKGNAYGMGALPVARFLSELGIKTFATATAIEALELRQALPGAQLLVMGIVEQPFIEDALRAGLILALAGEAQAAMLSAQSARLGIAARVHVKLNTGLNRIGFDAADGVGPILRALALPGISPEGVFTHLALRSRASDLLQLAALDAIADALTAGGHQSLATHALDSIGMVRYPDDRHHMARLGAWLWGVVPAGYEQPERCQPIQRFRARILQVRALKRGDFVGYDDSHPLARDARIATVSAGYADGYPRLTAKGFLEIHGKQAPLVGIVGMDALMVDVTDIPEAQAGDAVTLLGDAVSLWDYADWAGTNRNDAIERITRRVPRVYIRGGKPVSIADYYTACKEVCLT